MDHEVVYGVKRDGIYDIITQMQIPLTWFGKWHDSRERSSAWTQRAEKILFVISEEL